MWLSASTAIVRSCSIGTRLNSRTVSVGPRQPMPPTGTSRSGRGLWKRSITGHSARSKRPSTRPASRADGTSRVRSTLSHGRPSISGFAFRYETAPRRITRSSRGGSAGTGEGTGVGDVGRWEIVRQRPGPSHCLAFRRGCFGGWLRRVATEAADRSSERTCARRRGWRAGWLGLIEPLPPRGGGATRRAATRRGGAADVSAGGSVALRRKRRRGAASGCARGGGVGVRAGSVRLSRYPREAGEPPAEQPPPRRSRGCLGGWLRRVATEAAERSSEQTCARRRSWRTGWLGSIQPLPPRGGGATRRAATRRAASAAAEPRLFRRVAPSRCDGSGGEEQRADVREEAGLAHGLARFG